MEPVLNDIQVRILGCLIEKELTTPDYYPMTLNALTNACNQKSNRNPVFSFEETSVVRGLEELQRKTLTEKILKPDSRVPKYRHLFPETCILSGHQTVVLCILMLRGPQTAGEIRGHAGRMCSFSDIREVEGILNGLMERKEPLVIKLTRQIGQKEYRYMHLLSGKPAVSHAGQRGIGEQADIRAYAGSDRISTLESGLAALRRDFDELKKAFFDLKSQID